MARVKFTQEQLMDNIYHVYQQATRDEQVKGRRWYANARLLIKGLAETYFCKDFQVAGVVAALSPQCEWHRNLELTEKFLQGQRHGLHTGDSLSKAEGCLVAADVSEAFSILLGSKGWKVSNFFYNLLGLGGVTIDRHALDIAVPDGLWKWMTESRYDQLATAYTSLAIELGMEAHELQAVTWLCWRRMKGYENIEATS